MSKNTLIAAVIIIAAVVAVAVALVVSNGNTPEGEYVMTDYNSLFCDGEEHKWKDEVELGPFVIEKYENNVISGIWDGAEFTGIYDNDFFVIDLSYDADGVARAETAMGTVSNGSVFLTGIMYNTEDIGLIESYQFAFAKSGNVSIPELENRFADIDGLIGWKSEMLTDEYVFEFWDQYLEVEDSDGNLAIVKTGDDFEPYFSCLGMISDDRAIGIHVTPDDAVWFDYAIFVNDALVIDSWPMNTGEAFVKITYFSEDGQEIELPEIPDITGNVYTDGTHSISIMDQECNVAYAVHADGCTHMTPILWNGDGFSTISFGTPIIKGEQMYAHTLGTFSDDLQKYRVVSGLSNEEEFRAVCWNLEEVSDDFLGVYAPLNYASLTTEADGINAWTMEPYDNPLVIQSCENGIVKGLWSGNSFVGTYDGHMLSFFTDYMIDGMLCTDTVFAEKIGDAILMHTTYKYGDVVGAVTMEYLKVTGGEQPETESDEGYTYGLPLEADDRLMEIGGGQHQRYTIVEKTYVMPFKSGDVFTSFNAYRAMDGHVMTNAGGSWQMKVTDVFDGMVKMEISGSETITIVGFEYMTDVFWLAGFSEELLATYQLNIHEGALCLGRSTLFDGIPCVDVIRFKNAGMDEKFPPAADIAGTYSGTKYETTLDGQTYETVVSNVTVTLDNQEGYIAWMEDIPIHVMMTPNASNIAYADRTTIGDAEFYMDCIGHILADGSLKIYGHGDSSEGQTYAVVMILTPE